MDADGLPFRRLTFRSGNRERFWERNRMAIGLFAGFLEPLAEVYRAEGAFFSAPKKPS